MTISVKILAEPSSFEAEVVLQDRNAAGEWVDVPFGSHSPAPLTNGYMSQFYISSSRRLILREKTK